MSVTVLGRFIDQRLVDRAAFGQGAVRVGERATLTGTEKVFPLRDELRELLPWHGLRRGATVTVCGGPGATSVLLALLAGPVRAGSWCAVVGMPALGAQAAAELGVDLRRLALVPDPGTEWATVTAALLDGLDIVVVRPPGPVAARLARRLAARARQRGSVLVPYGEWDGADVVLRAAGQVWRGLGEGRGRLRSRELEVMSYGRGAATRPRRAALWLPAGDPVPAAGLPGAVTSVDTTLTLVTEAASDTTVTDAAMTEAS